MAVQTQTFGSLPCPVRASTNKQIHMFIVKAPPKPSVYMDCVRTGMAAIQTSFRSPCMLCTLSQAHAQAHGPVCTLTQRQAHSGYCKDTLKKKWAESNTREQYDLKNCDARRISLGYWPQCLVNPNRHKGLAPHLVYQPVSVTHIHTPRSSICY